MSVFQMKIGLATSCRIGTVKIYHVVKDGHTIFSNTNRDMVLGWIEKVYGRDAMLQAIKNEK